MYVAPLSFFSNRREFARRFVSFRNIGTHIVICSNWRYLYTVLHIRLDIHRVYFYVASSDLEETLKVYIKITVI